MGGENFGEQNLVFDINTSVGLTFLGYSVREFVLRFPLNVFSTKIENYRNIFFNVINLLNKWLSSYFGLVSVLSVY